MDRKATLLLVVFLLVAQSQAARIRDIDVHPDEIDQNDEFYATVYLTGAPCNHRLLFFLDNELFSSKNLRCTTDDQRSDSWDLNDKPKDCGEYELRVELFEGDESVEKLSKKIKIGNIPRIEITPARPKPNREVTIRIEDESGDPLRSSTIEIYRVKDGRVKSRKYTTDSQGEIEFIPGEVGEYRFIIDEPDYCGGGVFEVKRNLIIDGPHPENPVVGEIISIAVSASVGVKLVSETGDIIERLRTSIGGGVTTTDGDNLTIEKPGKYTLVIGEVSKTYWGMNKSFTVSELPSPSIEINPDKPVIGKITEIRVEYNGNALDDAIVSIERPDGVSEEYNTDSDGRVGFIPNSLGSYSVEVEKEDYSKVTKRFEARNSFNIDILPEGPVVGDRIRVMVRNQGGGLVNNAYVSTSIAAGLTNLDGTFEFKADEAGKYKIDVSKEGYWDSAKDINVVFSLKLRLSSQEIELGDSIIIKVYDKDENPVDIELIIGKPSGEEEEISGDLYISKEAGTHRVRIEKENFAQVEETFYVKPHPLDIKAEISGDKLKIEVRSHEIPIPGIGILLKTPTREEELVSDVDGLAISKLESGRIRIIVNTINVNKEYEAKEVLQEIRMERDYLLLIIPMVLIAILTLVLLHILPSAPKGKGLGVLKREKGKSTLSGL